MVRTGPKTSSRTIRIRLRDVGEDGRAVEEAGLELGLGRPAATGDEPRALGDGARDVRLDLGPVLGA